MTPPTAGAPLTAGNGRVKEARKLSRRPVRTGRRLFLADGPKAVEGALAVPGCVQEVFATPAARDQYAALLSAVPAVTLVDDKAMAGLSDSVTPAGLVAVCHHLDVPLRALLEPVVGPRRPSRPERVETHGLSPVEISGPDSAPQPQLLAICADVRDPGNAGTVIRCADAAGADGVVLAGDSVDAYNPKTVRATVGSLFHLPVAMEKDPLAAIAAARRAGLTVLAADGSGDVDLFDADELLARPTAWLFGNEAWGLPAELCEAADRVVRIPMFGAAESLNLSTAAALCLYASARVQHTRGG